MKASLKIRDDQKPLFRAKIPISILGLPFLSGVSAGDSRELRFDLATAFDSGPSLRASYQPNDHANHFTLSLRTGVGAYGSPVASPISIAAEFNLLSRSTGSIPSFSILLKPRFGDFSLKKSIKSSSAAPQPMKITAEDDSDQEPTPIAGFRPEVGIQGLIELTDVTASSVLPLRGAALVRFRWGLKLPPEMRTMFSDKDRTAANRLPLLSMSKISIEHVAEERKAKPEIADADVGKGSGDVGESYSLMKRQLDALRAENGALMKAVEDIKRTMRDGADVSKVNPPEYSRKAASSEDVTGVSKKTLLLGTDKGEEHGSPGFVF